MILQRYVYCCARSTAAICLLLCKEHSSVSVLVLVRGATVDFRAPPVLYRMVIASPGSFAFLGCTTASGETFSYWGYTQSLALKLFSHHWPLGTLMALTQRVGFACPRQLDAGGWRRKFLQIVITPHFPERTVLWLITSSAHWFNYSSNAEPTAISWRSICALIGWLQR